MDQNTNPGITDGRKYSLNDMVRVGCGDCKGCSACCHGMEGLVLNPKDIYNLTAHLGVSFEELMADKIKLQMEDGLVLPGLQMNGDEDACAFLDKNGRCGIHSFRPGICRLFPLGRDYGDGRIQYIFLVNGCQKQERTKVKVCKWIDTPDVEKEEEFLLKWHSFQKEARAAAGDGREAEKAKAVNLQILKTFYLTPYNREMDFYSQFEERLEQARMSLTNQEG